MSAMRKTTVGVIRDAHIIGRSSCLSDPQLPGLSIACDANAMRRVFEEQVFARSGASRRMRVRRCVIEHARYKRGRNAMFAYRVDVVDNENQVRPVRFCVRIYPAGRSVSRWRKALATPLFATPEWPSLCHVPTLEMLVWTFPNERKLKHLPTLMDVAWMVREPLSTLVTRHYGAGWQVEHCDHQLAHYVPEHGATVRITLTLCHTKNAERRQWCLYAKTFDDDKGAVTYRRMQQLWCTRASSQYRMARPLEYLSAHRILFQQAVDGHPLVECNPEDDYSSALNEALAKAFASFHRAVLAIPVTSIGGEDCLARLRERSTLLASVEDVSGDQLRLLLGYMEDHVPIDLPDKFSTLHGDLHPKNVLMHARCSVTLIDLDNMHTGSREKELGSWLATLCYRAIMRDEPIGSTMRRCREFLQIYSRSARTALCQNDLQWFIAYALVAERAYRCVTRMKGGRRVYVTPLLELALDFACRRVDELFV